MDLAAIADGLDPDQQAAVLTEAQPLAIVAGAGSGKTRVLTRRIARRILDGTADASHLVALTFTRRAAGELVDRLGAIGVRERTTVGTFHAVAHGVLRQRWDDLGRRPPELMTDRSRVLAAALHDDAGRGRARPSAQTGGLTIAELAIEIDWARARLVTPAQYAIAATAAGRRAPAPMPVVAEAFARYEKLKRARSVIDFDDLLALLLREIEHDRAFAEVQQWRFRHLFVDEAQDLNPLQFALLEAWRGARSDICLVGDPRQAIYGWNGADPDLFGHIERRLPGITVVRLDRNHRCTPQVVAAAEAVLSDAGHPTTATGADGPPVGIHGFADDVEEAVGIARILREARLAGRRWSSCAVLVRTNAQIGPLERALASHSIPCRARRGARLLDNDLVRSALFDAEGYRGNLRGWIDDLSADVATATGPDATILIELAQAVERFLAVDRQPTTAALRAWLSTDRVVETDAVEITTFHGAKGLEWPLVVISGAESGLVPHTSAAGPASRAEEVRLLHVAMTRAGYELHLTWAARRNGSTVRRHRSPLLSAVASASAIDDDVVAPLRTTPGSSRSTPTDPVIAALRHWRTTTARLCGLPEPSVCSDRALAAIAAHRPATIEELSAIAEVGPLAARRLGPKLLAAIDRADQKPGSMSTTTGA